MLVISDLPMLAQNSWVPTSLKAWTPNFASTPAGDIFAVGRGVFRSKDHGATWDSLTGGLPLSGEFLGETIGIGPNGTIFIGLNDRSVWRSRDSGDTWHRVDSTMAGTAHFAFTKSGEVWVISWKGMFKSTNDGDTWEFMSSSAGNCIVVDKNGKIYVPINGSVYASTDDGKTWSFIGNGLPGGQSFDLAVNPKGDIFAGTTDSGTFRSTDGGLHWVAIDYGKDAREFGNFEIDSTGVIIATSSDWGGAFRSTDNGDSWRAISRGLPSDGPLPYELLGHPIAYGGTLFIGTVFSGAYRRNEILTWGPLPTVLLLPADSSINVSPNALLSWQPAPSAISYRIQVLRNPRHPQVVFDSSGVPGTSVQARNLSYREPYFWRVKCANEEGVSAWSDTASFTVGYPTLVPPTPIGPGSGSSVNVTNPTLWWNAVSFAASYSVQVADDSSFRNILFESKNLPYTTVRTIDLKESTKFYWRVQTNRPDSISRWSAAWSFVTGAIRSGGHFPLAIGNTWYYRYTYSPLPTSYTMKRIEKDTVLSDGKRYAALLNYDKQTESATWLPKDWVFMRMEGDSLISYTDGLLVDFNMAVGGALGGSQIRLMSDVTGSWLGRDARILTFYNSNGGIYWSYADSLGFASQPSSPNWLTYYIELIAAVVNGREYGTLLTSVTDYSRDLPIKPVLDQNYPNPFNPRTAISYSLPKAANVTLRIFNTLGQEVALLVDEQKSPGAYKVQWNANVPSGIYFYRLQVGEFVETKKMILLK
jgi:hypothetical protein